MQNINGFYSTYYQTPFYHYNNNLFYSPQNNTINTFLNYNFKNIVASRTPSPPHHKRDIINLGYNTHFKNSSNSNILFLKLKDNNTLNNNMLINTNIHLIKNNSPFKHNFPFNVPKNDNKNIFLPNNSYYGESRNLKKRKIIINNMNLNNHKHGINYYINNSGNKSLDLINNDLSKNIHFRNINAHSHNNSMNSLNNIKLKKFLHLNDNNFNNIITIKNYNNYNQNKSATPILQYKINNIKVINDKNYQHNNDASNDIDFSKIQNLKNNIHIPILKTNKQNNRKENSVEMKSFENTPNTDRMINKNNLQSEIIQNNNILINFPLKSNNIIFNEKKKKQENINIIPIDKKKYFYFGEIGIIKGDTRKMINKESNPTDNFNITEFQIIKQIGKGGFGKIYCIKWIKNNRLYALKKYNLIKNELNYFKAKVEIVKYLTKKIEDNNGFIKIYGDKCIQQKNPNEIHYYIIMELGERDWFKELKIREAYFMNYSENELFDIITQLVKTLSLMQKNNITHRDIKLQNIILCKGIYKLCDFDESEIVNQNTEVCQTINGSKLYMSPILYYALKRKEENVIHNPYKSDVFSLGMCSLFAASFTRKLLCDIREIKDMNLISQIVNKALNKRYSHKFINLIVKMLQLDEKLRFDFLELEEYIAKI
jgi:hypothetical protein